MSCAVALFAPAALARPTLTDPRLQLDEVANGLGGGTTNIATGFVFVDSDTLLAARRGDGRIQRIDLVAGQSVAPGATVLDLDIIAPLASDSQTEYGIQGITLHPNFAVNHWVYIRYDLAITPGADSPQSAVATLPNFSASLPSQSVIDRFTWNPDANGGSGALTFDRRITSITIDTRYHHGGGPRFGPDGKLYYICGDQRHVTWIAGHSGLPISSNWVDGVWLDLGAIFRLNDDGSIPADNPWSITPVGARSWFGYGVRNSFGMDFDPATGALWYTDNGENTFDELNRADSGFNGGHADIMGPVAHPQQTGSISNLVVLPGSTYTDPKFSWLGTIGITGVKFLYGSALGAAFNNSVIVGNVNQGFLWNFRLNAAREGMVFNNSGLNDLVDDVANGYANPTGTEGEELLWGTGFGGVYSGTISMDLGPDRLLYVLCGNGRIYRISRIAPCPSDINGDDAVDTRDLVALLYHFGQGVHPWVDGDLTGDGHVDTLDLVQLLAVFGQCN